MSGALVPLLLALPLTALWGCTLVHAGRRALAAPPRDPRQSDEGALDEVSWLLLLLLTGWFGAVAYFVICLAPGLGEWACSRASERSQHASAQP